MFDKESTFREMINLNGLNDGIEFNVNILRSMIEDMNKSELEFDKDTYNLFVKLLDQIYDLNCKVAKNFTNLIVDIVNNK